MRYITATAIVGTGLAMPMAGSANAGWASFSERFSDKNIGKGPRRQELLGAGVQLPEGEADDLQEMKRSPAPSGGGPTDGE